MTGMREEKIMKKLALISLFIILIGSTTCFAADTIKFLVVGPMTGDSAAQGRQMRSGARIAIDEINAAGGINGAKLAFDVADDVGTPNQATLIAQKYSLDKNLLFVLGHNNSSCSIAALPIWEKAGLPVISPSNTSPTITQLGHKNYFRVIANDDIMSRQLAGVAVNSLGMKKPAIIWENSDYGKGMRDVAMDELPKLGVKVVAEDSFISGVDRDYSAIITKYKGAGVDGVLFLGDYTGGGLFAKQAHNLGLKVKLAGGSSCSHQKLIELGGEGAEDFHVIAPFDPFDTRPRQAEFIERFLKETNERPGEWSTHAYDIVYMVKAAYEAGGTDRVKLNKALRDLKGFEGITGNLEFNAFGDVTNKDAIIISVKGGKFVRVSE